jgi:hypothetical protein
MERAKPRKTAEDLKRRVEQIQSLVQRLNPKGELLSEA